MRKAARRIAVIQNKKSFIFAVALAAILALVVPVAAGAEEILPGPVTVLPDYIGAPAKAHPLANSGVPQNPNYAPNGFIHGHSDTWMTDTANLAGPLGRNPVTLSTDLAAARKLPVDSWLISGGSVMFDRHGRVIIIAYGLNEASAVLLDPETLEVLTHYPLQVPAGGLIGLGAQKFPRSLWAIYGFLGNRDMLHVVSESKKILTLEIVDTPSGPEFEPLENGSYDLTELVMGDPDDPSDDDRISGVMMDFQGRYWINMGSSANIYILNPATYHGVKDLKSIYLDYDGDGGEFTQNGLVLTKEGAAYIVTTKAMYRVDAGADDQPYIVWTEKYDNSYADNHDPKVKPGQLELGSGTTPTILGEGKYVAITDNAEQMHVVVFRTEKKLDPGEVQKVCEVEVFKDYGGRGANSNSLIGFRNSIVVQNTYEYLFNWDTGFLETPGKPGIERIDIDPNGRGCTKVWANKEVITNQCPRLSTRTGLIYTQDRKYDAEKDVYAVYWVALDFRTGKVVWEQLAGTWKKGTEARFDNFWTAIGIGPNGALYVPGYGGVMMIKDSY